MVGESPYNYMRRQKLDHVRRLLTEEPDTKIYRLAQRIGFSSSKQLAKAFRRQFGTTPRDYRKSARG
jgi:AraC-like DNA-binding protein